MLNNKLNRVKEFIESWCNTHGIYASIVCDTVGLQGVKIYEKDKNNLKKLFEDLSYLLKDNEIFLETEKVRGGVLLAFSIKAMSESEMKSFLNSIGETSVNMDFINKLDRAFTNPLPSVIEKKTKNDFDSTAKKIAEDQYKTAVAGNTRSNQSSRQRNLHTMTMTHGGLVPGRDGRRGKKSPKKLHIENNIRSSIDTTNTNTQTLSIRSSFQNQLHEALTGMATPTDQQPADLFKRFAQALTALGQQMGVGPLQNKLKEQGINYKKSDDGQAVILYIVNAKTKAPQPIARISAETLGKPHDFEQQLKHMIDFSKGEAPGAFQQHQEELRAQDKTVKDVAKSILPQQHAQGGVDAATAAAGQAAMPKLPAQPV